MSLTSAGVRVCKYAVKSLTSLESLCNFLFLEVRIKSSMGIFSAFAILSKVTTVGIPTPRSILPMLSSLR
jgi:hypothetical protein